MVLKLAEKIAVRLYQRGYIEESDIKIYRYGYSIIIDGVVDFTILFILGILIGRFAMVCVFAVVFSGLRQFTGGYHANKRWKCITISSLTCLACVFTPLMLADNMIRAYIYVVTAVSTVIIIKNAPIENKAKKLTDASKKSNWKKSAILSVILTILIYIFNFIFTMAAAVAATSMFAVALLIEIALLADKVEKRAKG